MTVTKNNPLLPIEVVWRRHRAAVEDALAEAIRELEDLLRLDEHHRHGHEPEQLERALGPLATASLDLGSLSRVLGESSRSMAPDRRGRVQQLIPALAEMKEAWSSTPMDAATIEIDEDDLEIRERAEAYLSRLSVVFRALRITQLELLSKYDSKSHDAVFAEFDWRALGPGEIHLSPPFVVIAGMDRDTGPQLRKLMSLLDTGMPIKVVALCSSFAEPDPGAGVIGVPARMTIETLPLAMRGVHFVQTCPIVPEFEKQLGEGLTAARPGVISLLCPRDDETEEAFRLRAERAVRARAFPICIYDPDRDESFVMCFDLSSNPSPELSWAPETLSGDDARGESVEIDEPFTFAHFAASESELAAELTDPPEGADDLVSLTDYLGFSRRQRIAKLPFISLPDKDGKIVRKIVSSRIVDRCSERLHLWRTLQEISGIDNPHVKAARSNLKNELAAQHEAQLENLQRDAEKDVVSREKAAVASAVRKLVARLTGIDPSSN